MSFLCSVLDHHFESIILSAQNFGWTRAESIALYTWYSSWYFHQQSPINKQESVPLAVTHAYAITLLIDWLCGTHLRSKLLPFFCLCLPIILVQVHTGFIFPGKLLQQFSGWSWIWHCFASSSVFTFTKASLDLHFKNNKLINCIVLTKFFVLHQERILWSSTLVYLPRSSKSFDELVE